MKLHQNDGGHRLHTDYASLLEPEERPASGSSHVRVVIAAVLVTALLCAAAQAFGFPISIPF